MSEIRTNNRSRYSGKRKLVVPTTKEEADEINRNRGKGRKLRTIKDTGNEDVE